MFTALLVLCSATPVLAAEPAPPSPSEIQEPPAALELTASEAPEYIPDQHEVTQGIEAVEREEERREKELETPAAEQEREESRGAFTDLSATGSKELLLEAFPEQLESLETDPARFLSEATLVHPAGEEAAVVRQEGDTSLLEAGIPVRAEDENGELRKVDLSLIEAEGGFQPSNPLVDVQIPGSASAPVVVGGEGLGISLADASAAAQRMGEQNVFYPEVQPDSDLLISPVSTGVELFDQLRSPQSPETLRFHVDLPEGAELRANGNGGADVVRGGEALATIPFPSAVDAQGAEVPVRLQVEGDAVVIDVAHRESEFAYPILVDPVLEDWINSNTSWYTGHNYQSLENGAWQWTSEPYGEMYIGTSCFYACWGSGRGLYVTAPSRNYGSEVHAHWAYLAPNLGSYVSKVWLNPFWREDHGCSQSQYPQPHDYDGFWGDNQWNLLQTNQAINVGSVAVESWGRSFIVGLSSAGGANIPCWRDLMVGGAAVWLDEWGAPAEPNVTGMPSGWIKKNSSHTIGVEASDGGLGVQEVRLIAPGEKHWPWNQAWCSGTYENRCAATRSGQITFSTEAFIEGEDSVSVNAVSAAGKVGPPRSYKFNVDGTAPGITMSGQLVTATAPEGIDKLSFPAYNLTVKAKDLVSTGASGSGVKRVKVFIDGKEVAGSGPTCTSTSCPTEYETTLQVPLTSLSENEHNVEVRAVDFVGNESPAKTWLKNFTYIPATGMKEEYVLQHFVLPDGKNHEGEEYEGPELAVNVMNGNLVYRERDLQVQGEGGRHLSLERIYNSMQPTARDGQWGHGFTLAQTPEFKPEASEPTSGKMLRTSAVTNAVNLPKTNNETAFSSRLHATVAKTQGGGYEVRSATEEEAQIFNPAGQIEEARLSSVSPEVTVAPEPVFPLFAESRGSTGSGTGQLDRPTDSAVDAKGNLWVVDKANNRLVEWNEAGEFLRTTGSAGAGAGQLSSPSAIAIDSIGNIDVTDTANNRVTRFNENGEFISTVGWNVNKTKVESGGTQLEKNRCTASSGNVCQAGLGGTGEGQIAEPIGIATTGGQNFFVVERAANRVEKFSPQAENLAKFGSLGSESGQLNEPTAIAYSPVGSGYLWVADTGNNRIQEWTTGYSYVRAVGQEGSGQVQFKAPAAVEADSEGNVYVGEAGNQRVQELSRSGDYITQFGDSSQFAFSTPTGLSLDSAGNLWIANPEADQVQEWMTGSFLFAGSRIGSLGTGTGQFNHPADVAPDGKGNLWTLDKGNNRLEKFGAGGEFLQAVGSKGGAAGQLNGPSALAIDPSGNIWVADTANNRIEEWNEAGQFVLTFGREVNKTKVETAGATEAEKNLCTAASGNVCQAAVAGSSGSQLKAPQGIAATASGNLWVADTGNSHLKKFGPTGSLLNNISSEGSEAGKVKEPTAIAMGPEGSVWVVDSGNNRIEEWNSSLAFVRQFGSEGTANGQFLRPAALDIDSAGNVWVGDQGGDRIQQFSVAGEYVSQLGGSAEFAFSGPMGMAVDNKGGLWVTDTDHNRVQRLLTSKFEKPVAVQAPAIDYSYSGTALTKLELKEPEAPDPSISVANTSGLATSATSGSLTTTYAYASGNLTAKKSSEGEVKYERDEVTNRIKRITLPNGTYAKITYDSLGRVATVSVKPAGGVEKTTNFKYETGSRKTYVWGTEKPEVIYYFGEDGSLLKWENAATPPVLESLGGSLWSSRNSTTLLENKDQYLYATAVSQNEIASIQVLINGNTIVEEATCQDNSQPPAHNCNSVTLEWITSAASHPPGRLDLEVVATDFLGHEVAERFFVTVPQQPPPDPEAPEKPTFESIKQFREEFGLDRTKNLSSSAQNHLILELLYEWEAQYPTATYSAERWGAPMRQSEISEMEYRENYINQAAALIPQWAEEHAPSTYGGYYVDNRQGGKIYVGFTADQSTRLAELKNSAGFIAPEQVMEYPIPPSRSLSAAEVTETEVVNAISESSSASQAVSSIGMEPGSTSIRVAGSNPALLKEFLDARFGSGAGFDVAYEPRADTAYSRFKASGPVDAGDSLGEKSLPEKCTAAFGTTLRAGARRGEPDEKYFVLTAGHCFGMGTAVYRRDAREVGAIHKIGVTRRTAWTTPGGPGGGNNEDAAGILLDDPSFLSGRIYVGNPHVLAHVGAAETAPKGTTVCSSGSMGGVRCGSVRRLAWFITDEETGKGYAHRVLESSGGDVSGDSGGPVWNPKTEAAVGIVSLRIGLPNHPCHQIPRGLIGCPRMAFTPLRPFRGQIDPLGALNVLGLNLFVNE